MENYANTAQILLNNDWYFTKERLADSPSRKSGIDAAKELSYRQQAANFIQDMGQRLQVSQLCINTAIVYMHRFYVFHSFKDIHRNSLSIAALFLAAKVEEQPRKLEHVIKVAHMCIHKDASPLDVRCEAYQEKVNETVAHENILLACLGFILAIEHPHTYVVKVCQLVKASKDLAQTSYIMATTSLHMTQMCLQYKPPIVACVCIHLACKWSSYKIEPCSQGNDWFYYVDRSVTWKLLETLTQDYISILERSPHRFKNKLVRDEPNSLSARYTPALGDILSDSVPPSIPRTDKDQQRTEKPHRNNKQLAIAHHSKEKPSSSTGSSSSNNHSSSSEKPWLAEAHQSAAKEGMPVARRIKPNEKQTKVEFPSLSKPHVKPEVAMKSVDWVEAKPDWIMSETWLKTQSDLDDWAKASAVDKMEPKMPLDVLMKAMPEVKQEIKMELILQDCWAKTEGKHSKSKLEMDPWAIANANLEQEAKADLDAWALANANLIQEPKVVLDPWAIANAISKQEPKVESNARSKENAVVKQEPKKPADTLVTSAPITLKQEKVPKQEKFEQPSKSNLKLEDVLVKMKSDRTTQNNPVKVEKHKVNSAHPEPKLKHVNAFSLPSDSVPQRKVEPHIEKTEVKQPQPPEVKTEPPLKVPSEKRDKHKSKRSHSKDRPVAVDHLSTKQEPAHNGKSSAVTVHTLLPMVDTVVRNTAVDPYVMLERVNVKPEKIPRLDKPSSSSERKEKHKSSKHSKDKSSSNHSPGIKLKISKDVLGVVPDHKPLKIKLPKPPPPVVVAPPPPTTSLKLVITKDKYGSGSYSASSHKHRKRTHSRSPHREHKHQKLDRHQDKASRHSRSSSSSGSSSLQRLQNSSAMPPLPPPLPPPPPPPPLEWRKERHRKTA